LADAVTGVAREGSVRGLSEALWSFFGSVAVDAVDEEPNPSDRKSRENPRLA
jgi:hypothetical protein